MNEKHTWNISIQQIQIFLKAVQLRNFTQVARFFNFTPSMVSKTITTLENELGIHLFTRKPHELTPTPAALLLAEEWRQLMTSVDNSIAKAKACQECPVSKIMFGFVDSSRTKDERISHFLIDYKNNHPGIQIYTEKHDMHRAAELLKYGMLDVVFTSITEVPYLEENGLLWEKVTDTHNAAYVPRGNPLFYAESLSFSDLKREELTALDASMHPTYRSWLHNLCVEHGFTPHIEVTYRTVRSLLFGLKLQNNIFIGDTINADDWCDENLKAFELPGEAFVLIAWRKNAKKEVLQFKDAFIKFYNDTLLSK